MNKKVFLGFSGGIDSTYAALLLKEKDYEIIGVYQDVTGNKENIKNAQEIANILGISLTVRDLRKIFAESVIKFFKDQYLKGLTPNPCVFCNYYFKFHYLLKESKGYPIATGHYAKIKNNFLYRAKDVKKDQTYFLARLTPEYLKRIIFPMGDILKEEAKDILLKKGIPIKKESQDLCFMKGDYRNFIETKEKEGNLFLDNKIVGKHKGFWQYTIGQRKGIGIVHKTPLYVYKIDPINNNVYIGEENKLYSDTMHVFPVILREYKKRVTVKIRSMHIPAEAEWEKHLKEWIFIFKEEQKAVTPGQWVAIYDKDKIIGGGWIKQEY